MLHVLKEVFKMTKCLCSYHFMITKIGTWGFVSRLRCNQQFEFYTYVILTSLGCSGVVDYSSVRYIHTFWLVKFLDM
jgi:hypothetical protein